MADTLELSAEEQALMDQMRADDAQSGSEAQVAQEPVQQPPEVPAQPAAPATPEQPAAPRQDMVPHQALHAEREEHKRTRSELAAERERIRTLEERTNLLLQRFNQSPQPAQPQPQPGTAEAPKPPPIPDLDKDPVGHIIGRQLDFDRRLQEQGQNWQQQQAAYQQQLQAQQTLTALTQHAQALESQFSLEHPDYPAAVAHLMRVRHQELERVGFRNPAERQQILQQEGLGVAARMYQIGGNPAEAIYELARMRGYAPPTLQQAQPAAAQPNGADQDALPVEPAPPPAAATQAARPQSPTGVQRLQTLAQGQEQARSLGNARGAGPVPLTANRLVEMSQDEFAAFLEKASPDQMAEMFGS